MKSQRVHDGGKEGGGAEGGGEGGKSLEAKDDRTGYAQTHSQAQAQTWGPYLSL